MGTAPHDPTTTAAEERKEQWSELPAPIDPEDTVTSEESQPPAPDIVADPDHEFMIRHAG